MIVPFLGLAGFDIGYLFLGAVINILGLLALVAFSFLMGILREKLAIYHFISLLFMILFILLLWVIINYCI